MTADAPKPPCSPRARTEPHTDDEAEFLAAILLFRQRNRRLPTILEGFRIAKALGWRKGDDV